MVRGGGGTSYLTRRQKVRLQSWRSIKKTEKYVALSFLSSELTASVFLRIQKTCRPYGCRSPTLSRSSRAERKKIFAIFTPAVDGNQARVTKHASFHSKRATRSSARGCEMVGFQRKKSLGTVESMRHWLQNDLAEGKGVFLAPPPGSRRVHFLILCFLNAAPRLYSHFT